MTNIRFNIQNAIAANLHRICSQFAAEFAETSILLRHAISMPTEDDPKKQVKNALNKAATAAERAR